MKGFLQEFRQFINRGNVLDLAVGVLIGGAFSSITSSLTKDVITPLVSIFLGGVDFSASSSCSTAYTAKRRRKPLPRLPRRSPAGRSCCWRRSGTC